MDVSWSVVFIFVSRPPTSILFKPIYLFILSPASRCQQSAVCFSSDEPDFLLATDHLGIYDEISTKQTNKI